MKTYILLVMIAGQPPQALLTTHCDLHIRAMSVAMPDADLYCIAPEYALRPVARGEL